MTKQKHDLPSISLRRFAISSMIVLIVYALPPVAVATNRAGAVNLAGDSLTFCMSDNCAALPETSLFGDLVNNSIGNACLHNVPLSRLRVSDLNDRLEVLKKGNVIVVRGEWCSLTYPVIVGSRRRRLQIISGRAAIKLRPKMRYMIQRLRLAVPDRSELVFHLLWSRVMDDVWDRAWQASFGTTQLPDATWAVSPQHSFTIGTYFYPLPGNGLLALTQGPNSWKYKNKIISLSADLNLLAWGRIAPAEDQGKLRELGMLDTDARFRVLSYHKGDSLDRLLEELASEYAKDLAGVYGYNALAKSFGITPAQAFYMFLHETAYAIFDDLSRSDDLRVPSILTSGDESSRVVEVVSIRTAEPE